jgi:hypothetical protein
MTWTRFSHGLRLDPPAGGPSDALVAIAIAAEVSSATAGHAATAAFAVPALVLAGPAWLARR